MIAPVDLVGTERPEGIGEELGLVQRRLLVFWSQHMVGWST